MKTFFSFFLLALSIVFAVKAPDQLIAAGERYRANQKAEAALEAYATKRAIPAGAKVTLKESGEQITLGGKVRRKVYDVVYTVGNTSVTQKASITIQVKKNFDQKVVQLAAWPNKDGGMDIIPL